MPCISKIYIVNSDVLIWNSDILFVSKSFLNGRSMSGIHSRFGPDCLVRSCPAVPCTLGQDKTFNPKVFPGYGEFYQTKMPLKRHFSFDLVKLAFLSRIWYLAPKKSCESKWGWDWGEDFVGWSEKCLRNDLWIFPSVQSPAFYPNFPPTHLHPLIPQYVTDTGGGRREEGRRETLGHSHGVMQEVISSFISHEMCCTC